jgi:hypothetical protein
MKIVGRIAYALLAVFTFWFVIDYARGAMTIRYFENEGQTAVEEGDDVFFYGSAHDYNQRGAVYATTQSGYTLSIYEIADVKTNPQFTVTPYLYVMLRSDEPLDDVYSMKLIEGDTSLEWSFYRFRTLNLQILLNEDQNEYGILAETIVEGQFTTLQLLDVYKNIIFEASFTLDESELVLEEAITTYYETHEELPFTALIDHQIYPKITHDFSRYISIMYIAMGVYVAVLILSTYIVFFMKKKYLGRKKPSDILLREQNKYKKGDPSLKK